MPDRYSEDEIIANLFKPVAGPAGFFLDDDAAFLPPMASARYVVTTDALVAGVHFFADDPPDAIARKALRVNLSDLAAKGAMGPYWFLLTLTLPGDVRNAWLEAFAAGLKEDAESFGARLIGGDTCRTPGPLVVSITAFGDTGPQDIYLSAKGRAPRATRSASRERSATPRSALLCGRDPARAARLSAPSRDHLLARYLLPRPRLDLAARLRACASAAMDVSDGLAGDLAKLCRASGIGAIIEAAQVPLSAPAREAIALEPRLLETALTGGDDYEILFTAPASSASFRGVTRIGVATSPAAAPVFRDAAQNTLNFVRPSYRHF